MNGGRGISATAIAAASFGTWAAITNAMAELVCIDASGDTPATCALEPCGGWAQTVAEGVVVAETFSGPGPGQRPPVTLCVTGSAPHVETVEIDNSGGQVGEPLRIVGEVPLCPAPESSPSQPVVTLLGVSPIGDSIRVELDMRPDGPCGGPARPGLAVFGQGSVTIEANVLSYSGFGAWTSNRKPGLHFDPDSAINDSRFMGGVGPAVIGTGTTVIRSTLFEGNDVGTGSIHPFVVGLAGEDDSALLVDGSAFIGNIVTPAEEDRGAVVAGALYAALNSNFVANAIGAGSSVLSTGLRYFSLQQDRTGRLVAPDHLQNLSFEGNVSISGAQEATWPVAWGRAIPRVGDAACAGEDALTPLSAGPWIARPALNTAVVRIDGRVLPGDGSHAWLQRLGFYENDLPGGSLVSVYAPSREVVAQVTWSTFGGNRATSIVTVDGDTSDLRFYLLHNLVLGATGLDEPRTILRVDSPLRDIIESGNVTEADIEAPYVTGTHFELVGPRIVATTFDPTADALAGPLGESACGRLRLACSENLGADCAVAGAMPWTCLSPTAMRWAPSDAWLGTLPPPWPWSGTWPEPRDLASVRFAAPGAGGGPCWPARGTYDDVEVDGEPRGDGDGAPDAVDCDNEDPFVVPTIPTPDGYRDPTCAEIEGDCYACPPGTVEPLVDDDSAEGDEAPADPARPPSTSSCGTDGCGYSWSVLPGAVLTSLWPRRRRMRSR